MSYSYKQWTADQTADNVIHASDLERWQDGITDAGGTWSGSWTDEKDTLTADQLNALETEIASLYGAGFTAKTWEDGQVPGVDEWNRIEDAINTILNRTAFAIYCETDNSLTFYVDTEVPSVGDTYDGKVVAEVYTGLENTNFSGAGAQPWASVRDNIQSVVINSSFNMCKPKSLQRWFMNFGASFTGLNYIDTSEVTNLLSTFNSCTALTSIDALANWDVSKVTTLYYTFNSCTALTSIDALANWDVSKVTSLDSVFRECTSLTSIDALANWDVSKVTSLSNTFRGCTSLKNMDGIAGWDVSNVTTFTGIAYDDSGLTELHLPNWNLASATEANSIFYGCTSVETVDLSNWSFPGLTSLRNLLYNCTSAKEADLSGWDTSNLTEMRQMFTNCSKLVTVYVSDGQFNTDKVTQDDSMFSGCTSIVGGNGTTFDSSKIDSSMAHIDTEDNPGYFTAKG